jgi:monoamine oxidase
MIAAEVQRPKIVVVGGGIAGLTAAYRLQEKGADVHLYEARGRVGGRILTAKIGGYVAELGGQNIADGGDAENIHRLICEFNLELEENKFILDHSYFTGEKLIPLEQLLEEKAFDPDKLKEKLNKLAQSSKNMRDVLNGILDPEEPLYKINAVRLAGYEGGSPESLSPLYAKTLYHMLLGGLSTAHQDHSITFLSVKKGNDHLTEKLAQPLGGRLHLNKILKKILKVKDGFYTLVFQDGKKVKADVVILAIPCSVFVDIDFEENVIPLERLTAIRNVQYGTNSKIEVPLTKPPIGWRALINDHMGCFFTSPSRQILTLYYVGEASRFTQDTIEQVYNQDKSMIALSLGELPLKAPICAIDQSGMIYEGPVGYSWPNDPYVKGTYSYIAQGQEAVLTATHEVLGETVKTLFAPIDQKLYFAGEHASILEEVPGTMEAACESGERTARMILKSL